jgi:hypothetical protein
MLGPNTALNGGYEAMTIVVFFCVYEFRKEERGKRKEEKGKRKEEKGKEHRVGIERSGSGAAEPGLCARVRIYHGA